MGVKHVVAVSSCTTGLLLTVQALGLTPGSEVIIPSFTFMATGLGPVWNGLRLRFVDVDSKTMNLDPEQVEAAITPNTSAIIGVHQFGNPAPCKELQQIANCHGLTLIYDAAHGLGSQSEGMPLGGHGKAEIFSLSPTKVMIAGEGGIVATNDDAIAHHITIGRNYGNPGDYDCLFPGLNARMSEFHAILALESFRMLENAARQRNQAAERYRKRLGTVPGIGFQRISENTRSSYKDLCIVVNENEFGLTQPTLVKALLAEGIHTRVYYSPVLHRMEAFRRFAGEAADRELPNTLYLESHALSLPLYSDMTDDEIDLVCAAIERIHTNARSIQQSERA